MLILLNGGVSSLALVQYIALPISAAWLLNYNATLWLTAGRIFSALFFAVLEAWGAIPSPYSAGTPAANLRVMVPAMLMAAVPVAHVLRIFSRSLEHARDGEAAHRREHYSLSRIIEPSPVAIMAFDGEGKLAFAIDKAYALLRHENDNSQYHFFHPRDWHVVASEGSAFPEPEQPFVGVRSSLKPVYDMRYTIERPNGELFSCH